MTNICVYPDVLGTDANAAIYRMAVGKKGGFEQSRVVRRGVDRQIRASTVLYDVQLREVVATMKEAVLSRLEEAVPRLGMSTFDVGDFEIQLTSHNDGEFFHRHTDSASRDTADRALTYVYYFHRLPKGFTGGELVFFGGDGSAEVLEPSNDTLVLFDPRTEHEVRPISCRSGRFEDGRFTLNGWLHRRPRSAAGSTFFDQKIFTPVRRWVARPRSNEAVVDGPAPRGAAPAADPQRPSDLAHLHGLLMLYGDLHRSGSSPDAVDVRSDLDGQTFFDQYYSRNRPVVLPGAMASCDAVRTWSPDFFAEHYSHVEVQITSGRDATPDYERRYREMVRTVSMRQLAERLVSEPESNDFYLIARNNFFDNPRLRPLRDALRPPAGIIDDRDRRPGAAKLWIGPKGTVTPLHFDEHSILFAQVHGRKHFKLVPSFDYPRMYVHHTYYSEVDPEQVDARRHPLFADASVMDVIVEPGDCLFLPVGWWHWARSLSVSISATFSSFARPWTNIRLFPATR